MKDRPLEEQLTMLRELSPLQAASKDTAPTLIIHGDADKAVPYEQSERFVAKLTDLGVPHQLITRTGAGHSWSTMNKDDTLRADWFDKLLKPAAEKQP